MCANMVTEDMIKRFSDSKCQHCSDNYMEFCQECKDWINKIAGDIQKWEPNKNRT